MCLINKVSLVLLENSLERRSVVNTFIHACRRIQNLVQVRNEYSSKRVLTLLCIWKVELVRNRAHHVDVCQKQNKM